MSKFKMAIMGVLLVFLYFRNGGTIPNIPVNPTPYIPVVPNVPDVDIDIDVPDISEPDTVYKSLVEHIVNLDIEKEDSKLISSYYSTLADVVKNDVEFIKTTKVLKDFNSLSGQLLVGGTDLKGKYTATIDGEVKTLGTLVDDAMINAIGKQNKTIDSTTRGELVKVFNAVAWAVYQ